MNSTIKHMHYAFPVVLLILVLTGVTLAQGSHNIDLLSVTNQAGTKNDVWGYVDGNGTEYAIIGSTEATFIYSLEDPAAPILRKNIPGTFSTWRDIKHFGDYAYVIADVGTDGLLIIDMSGAPGTISHSFWQPTFNINGEDYDLERCHNLYIDEDGYCYLSGCEDPQKGVIILDLFSNPGTPSLAGVVTSPYAHDVYVRDSVMYTSAIYSGEFRIYDVSDRSSPVFLASQSTGRDFTHNAWLSDDSHTIFTTDERTNAWVEAYDISNLGNISLLDRFRPQSTIGSGVIPHNVHVLDDYLVISYYTHGVVIVDAAQPDNLIEVGWYDTHPGLNGTYGGCWGAYPFLPSGIVLASDRDNGLYVLDPIYERACYLRGTVYDSVTQAPIQDISVEIVSPMLNHATTDNFGEYATGLREDGTYDVIFSSTIYNDDTVQVDLNHGVTTQVDVFLAPYVDPCPDERYVGGVIESGEYQGGGVISNGTIPETQDVLFRGVHEVLLKPEFEVVLGGELETVIEDCIID